MSLTLELNKNNNNRSKLILKSKLSLNKFYFILLDEVAHAQHPAQKIFPVHKSGNRFHHIFVFSIFSDDILSLWEKLFYKNYFIY